MENQENRSDGCAQPDDGPAFTVDDFLGGGLRLKQPRDGYRISMDTVLLAACVQAKAGETVLEGGVGSAGAALCLAHRLEGVRIHGTDIQKDMLDYARYNIRTNGYGDRVSVALGSVTDLGGAEATYDHVMINPPYLAAGKAIRPPAATKGLAHMDSTATLKDWIKFCIYQVKNRGTVTIIYRADRLDEVISLLYRRVGEIKIMPLWPRQGTPAKRVIIQGRKGVHGASVLLPGLALHGEEDRYTEDAEAILRQGCGLFL